MKTTDLVSFIELLFLVFVGVAGILYYIYPDIAFIVFGGALVFVVVGVVAVLIVHWKKKK